MSTTFENNNRFKKNEIVVFTTVFPESYEFFSTFFKSLEKQTYKSYDLLIINDGVKDLSDKIKKDSINTLIVDTDNSISKNRELGIKCIIELDYKYAVFIDSDDYVKENRIEVAIKKLNKFDIVVNDISLFDYNGIYNERYFSQRIANNKEIKKEFLSDKNIFGLSNTSLKVSLLKGITFSKNLKVVDWVLFSTLFNKGINAIFTNETITYYRQYNRNLVSIDKYDKDSLINCLSIKKKHYKEMGLDNEKYLSLYEETCFLEEKVLSGDYILDYKKVEKQNLFWWEITNYLRVKNKV